MAKLSLKAGDPWDHVLVVSLLVLAIAGGLALVPPARRNDPAVGLRTRVRGQRTATEKAKRAASKAHDRVVNRTWALPPEALGVRVMDAVDEAAERRGLKVSNFVVGRPIESAGLRQVPFSVTLDGPFPSVLATLAELEKPATKLVIGGVKLAPSQDDVPRGGVAATLSLTAFLRGEGG